MTEVIMTKMGDAMEEGVLLRWIKKEGEKVNEGDPIAEIQTDKANVELQAPATGTLTQFKLSEGESLPVGQTIAYIAAEGENASTPQQPQKSNGSSPYVVERSSSEAQKTPVGSSAQMISPPSTNPSERVKATPLAKRLAMEAGLDLKSISGTGPDGRIVERDILKVIKKPVTASAASSSLAIPKDTSPIELSRMRKTIALRTVTSKQTVPHFYVTSEVDMDALVALREHFNSDESSEKLSINDFIIKACAIAISKNYNVNHYFDKDKLVPISNVNIGVAVSIEEGLMVPVLRECERKSLRTIASEMKAMAQKSRSGQLTPEEMSGSSFSISNLGMFDVDNFIAIINPPNSAILAVGSMKKVPSVLTDGSLGIKEKMKMTLSADHRVLDGAAAAIFLREIKQLLESPIRLVE